MNEVSPENLLRSPPWRLRQNRKPPSSTTRPARPGKMYGGSMSDDRKLSSATGAGAATAAEAAVLATSAGADATTSGGGATEAATGATTAGLTTGDGVDGIGAGT